MSDYSEMSNDQVWETTKSADLLTRADALVELAQRARVREDWAEAKTLFGSAADLYRDLGKDYDCVRATYSLGYCQTQLEEFEEAISTLKQSLSVGRELNDAETIGSSAGTLGDALRATGRSEEAVEAYELALESYSDAQENFFAGLNALNLGELHGQAGRHIKALESFLRGYNHFQTAGDYFGSARSKDRMASALIELGDYPQALSHLHDSLKVLEFIEEEERVAFLKYRIGWTLNLAEDYLLAEKPLREAISYFRTNKLWSRAALAEKQLYESLIFRDLTIENQEAISGLERVVSFFESAGEQANAISARAILPARLQKLGKYKEACSAWAQLLDDALILGEEYFLRQIRLSLAESLLGRGLAKEALEQLEQIDENMIGETKVELERISGIKTMAAAPKANRSKGGRTKQKQLVVNQ